MLVVFPAWLPGATPPKTRSAGLESRAAARGTGVSLGVVGGQFRDSLHPSGHHSTIVLRGLRRPRNEPFIMSRASSFYRAAEVSFFEEWHIGGVYQLKYCYLTHSAWNAFKYLPIVVCSCTPSKKSYLNNLFVVQF